MTTKTTLLAAAAISAMAFAGAANAGTLTAKVNTIDATAAAPYAIAKERNDAADVTAAGGLVLTNLIATANQPVIAVAAPTKTYEVKIDITGGTIPAASTAALVINQTVAGGATVGASACTISLRSESSITFLCTVNAPTVAGTANVTGFTLTGVVANSAAEANIAFASSINDVTGNVLVSTVDTSASTTLITYSNVVQTLSVTSRDVLAGLPDFKAFKAPALNPASVSTSLLVANVGENYTVTQGAGNFYTGLASATAITRDGIINGATVVVTGNAIAQTTLVPTLNNAGDANTAGTAIGTRTRSGTTATFALNNAEADAFSSGTVDLRLTQTATAADQVGIAAGTFTTVWTPVYASGYTTPTTAQTVNSGVVTLDGTNFIAPWFSGSQAQSQSQVRLSNTAPLNATVRVSITNGVFSNGGVATTFGDAACATGPFVLPVNGDLILSSAAINSCFGAFLRGDLLISVEAAGSGVTAKMRNTSSQGNFETTLGRYSGADASQAAQ